MLKKIIEKSEIPPLKQNNDFTILSSPTSQLLNNNNENENKVLSFMKNNKKIMIIGAIAVISISIMLYIVYKRNTEKNKQMLKMNQNMSKITEENTLLRKNLNQLDKYCNNLEAEYEKIYLQQSNPNQNQSKKDEKTMIIDLDKNVKEKMELEEKIDELFKDDDDDIANEQL